MIQNTNLLAIDIGNSTIGIGYFSEDQLERKYYFKTQKDIQNQIKAKIRGLDFKFIYVSSVVPQLNDDIIKLAKEFKITPCFISFQNKTRIEIKIDSPHELGADRIVNANGGVRFLEPPLIIIDSGTATTFDIVDENYHYIGGVIFPGVDISLRSLADNTAKLKMIEFYPPLSPIGQNSADCIRAGIYYGYIGSLNYLIKIYKEILGVNSKVIVTGGLVRFFKNTLEGVDLYEEDLIFYGLHSIFKESMLDKNR